MSELDFSRFRAAPFEFEKKGKQINLRVSKQLLEAVNARAKARGISVHAIHSGDSGTGYGHIETVSMVVHYNSR